MFSYTEKFNRIDTHKLISNNFYKDECRFFWENNKSKQTIITFGCIDVIEIFNVSDLDSIHLEINEKLNAIMDLSENTYISPKFFGGHAFSINSITDDNWNDFPRGYFILPKCMITSNENDTSITLIKKISDGLTPQIISKELNDIYNGLIQNQSKITTNEMILKKAKDGVNKTDYLSMINSIINDIKSGTLRKLVLSKSKHLKLDGKFNLSRVINKLRGSYPECINFFMSLPGKGIFFGSTPERLVEKNKSFIKSEAIAGTIKRGKNIKQDELFENELKNDLKSLEEHGLVVNKIKKILNPKVIDINVSKYPDILKLKNVQHLISNISGELKEDMHILELVKILHPTPAVSGDPVDKACELIDQYEKHDRGWYAGPLGWIDSFGSGDFCVALRSALVGEESIHLFSGGGIVLNSIPEKEWEETELKLKTILEIIKEKHAS